MVRCGWCVSWEETCGRRGGLSVHAYEKYAVVVFRPWKGRTQLACMPVLTDTEGDRVKKTELKNRTLLHTGCWALP